MEKFHHYLKSESESALMDKASFLKTFINYHIAKGDIEFTASTIGELESVNFNGDVYESLAGRLVELDAIDVKNGEMTRGFFDEKYSYRSNYEDVVNNYIENE